ncbi:MAG: HlyD family type I secretion periplasmic adaptor subunit [Rickettsiales bacterium]|nr:HlyD family type I secretion periplasmic adaptor subunit [Rickettsiales bacterium]
MKKMRKISNKFFEKLRKYKVLNFLITKLENFYSVLPKNKAEIKGKTKDLKQKFLETKELIKKNAVIFFNKEYDQEDLNIARKPILIGIWTVFALVFVSIVWGVFVKIDSAAIAMGTVVLEANRKTVQHFEGGIIDEILVNEGDTVKNGQILIKLDETSSKAGLEVLKKQMFALQASKKRLEAERDRDIIKNIKPNPTEEGKEPIKNEDKLNFSEDIFTSNINEELSKIIEGEEKLFDTRNKTIDSQIDVLQQRIKQYEKQIDGLRAQERSISNRIVMARNELESSNQLYQRNIISETDYLAISKQVEELEGNKGEYVSNIAKTKQAIGETEMEIINTKTEWLNAIVKDLQDTQNKINDMQERLTASSDVLARTNIIAQQSGIVTNLRFHTKGGVIPANAPVLDIIPQNDKLVAEVKVNPKDIDVVSAGLKAKIRLLAYRQREVPLLHAKVINVSADVFQDEANGGVYYYKAKVEVNEKELSKLKNVKLYPGMPIEVFIVTGSRTFFQYLFTPISDSMRKAFREE